MTPFKYIFAFLSLALIALATPIAEKAEVLSDLQSDGYNTTLSSLAPRNKDGVHCCKDNGRGWKYAPVKNFDRARNDLFFTPNLKIKIGPRGCGATFGGCDAGTVVEICNDNNYAISPDAKYLYSYTVDIVRQCTMTIGGVPQVCGQNFDTDKYNIIMRGC